MCQVSVRVHNGGSSSSCSWSQVSDNKINSNPNFTSVCPLRSLVGSLSHFTSIYPVWERVRFRSRTDQSLPRPGVLRLQGPALGGQMAGDCENLLVTRDSVLSSQRLPWQVLSKQQFDFEQWLSSFSCYTYSCSVYFVRFIWFVAVKTKKGKQLIESELS